MLQFLMNMKGRLTLVLSTVIGALLLYINSMSRKRTEDKLRQAEEKIKRKDVLYDEHVEATEAMTDGLANEDKPVTRGYFDK